MEASTQQSSLEFGAIVAPGDIWTLDLEMGGGTSTGVLEANSCLRTYDLEGIFDRISFGEGFFFLNEITFKG